MKKNTFIINVRDLFVKDTGVIDTYKVLDSILESDIDDFSKSVINGKVDVVKINNYDVLVEFDLNCKVRINCVRCLKKYPLSIRIKFNQTYSINPVIGEQEYVIKNYQIDISNVIVEEIITHLPIKPLCSQNCSGIIGHGNYRKD
ncbi:MAG: hypothetical protein ACD_58C00123G0002 [uncultured bacterium]|nr:MAG: hypothetical protein ACD_58C00123G0002 [uncultured bacterium]